MDMAGHQNPDDFSDGDGSIEGLQTLVREHLAPNGIGALYGFGTGNGTAFKHVKKTLRPDEGIDYDASSNNKTENKTPKDTIEALRDVNKGHRIGSYGWDELAESFGNCHEAAYKTCTELRQAKESGNWAKVFGWTVTRGQGELVDKLFDVAGVDGTIYGFANEKYSRHKDTRAAAKEVLDWIDKHRKTVKVADASDPLPWTENVEEGEGARPPAPPREEVLW